MKICVLTKYDRLGASSRLRFIQYFPYFNSDGFVLEHFPLISDELLTEKYKSGGYRFLKTAKAYFVRLFQLFNIKKYDLVWIQAEALPYMPSWFEKWLLRNNKVVLDYDDAIFHSYDMHSSRAVRAFLGDKLDSLMSRADLVIAGNDYLAQRALNSGCQRVEVVPTVIDLDRYHLNQGVGSVPVIGWIGSPSTARYLQVIEPALRELSKYHCFELWVIGAEFRSDDFSVRTFPWTESQEVSYIQNLSVGIMPLLDTPWEKGKCGYKLIQYMACGKPVVATPVGVNKDIVVTCQSGMCAESTEEWLDAMLSLLNDHELARNLGCNGRVAVEQKFCLQVTYPRLKDIFSQLLS